MTQLETIERQLAELRAEIEAMRRDELRYQEKADRLAAALDAMHPSRWARDLVDASPVESDLGD